MAVLLAAIVVAAAFWVALVTVDLPERLKVPDSVVVTWRDGSPAHVFLSPDERWRMAVSLDDVDPHYVAALLAFEDQRFWNHPGVDPLAVVRAAISNLTSGRRVSGASTITMQVVRLLEPRPRTLSSKVVEAFRAVQLELFFSKREILEQYLRLAPFGRNVEGVEAACWAYFGHGAGVLTAEEIAVLLAVPQGPASRFPKPENLARLRAARDRISKRLLDEDLLPRGGQGVAVSAEELYGQILAASPPSSIRPFPREVPHLAYWARQKFAGQTAIGTTLDAGTQRVVDELVARRREEALRAGARHVSVVVADHATLEVRALVGNFSFDDSPGSQIPSFDVARSPGSLLKPFILAAAIDLGLALPRHLVPDIPFRAGTYAPENFDGKFSGLARLDDALVRSLNIPFVELLNEVGVENFIGQLRTMGAEHIAPTPGHYGLTAAVGGVEMTPLEVTAAYATLARGGQTGRLRVFGTPSSPGPRVYSPGATWLVRQVLQARDRPDFSARRLVNPFGRRVFWKTGTSFGNRDAWAVGAGDTTTVSVWMGNHDRAGSSAIVGSERSGPLLFDVLEAVEHEGAPAVQPEELTEVEVCAYSGHVPGPACETRTTTLARRDRVPARACPYHVHADVDEATGLVLTPECRDGRRFQTRAFLQWPAAVRRYLNPRSRSGVERPAYAPGCRPKQNVAPPTIVSPPLQRTLMLRPELPADQQQQPLEADAADSAMMLNWYVDGVHVGSGPAGERQWWTPTPGRHEIVVTDELGRSVRREVEVR